MAEGFGSLGEGNKKLNEYRQNQKVGGGSLVPRGPGEEQKSELNPKWQVWKAATIPVTKEKTQKEEAILDHMTNRVQSL